MNKKIPFLDLRIIDDNLRKDYLNAIDKVFKHGRLVLGPEVEMFESEIAQICGKKYCVGVNSGTDALFLALKCLGIGYGDEVITTSLSWIATANAIALTGASPVFADINNDLNIDAKNIERLITPKTKAILPVHYTGKICDMDILTNIAKNHNLFIIEDACQSFGAEYKGKKAGSFGDISCFSMNPMKVLGAFGEAGAIVTNKESYKNKLISLRYNGTINREECIEISFNARLDTIQAALLLKRIKEVDKIINKRRKIASWYNENLKNVVITPYERSYQKDIYYTYTIRAQNRDKLKTYLESKGIETKIQHPILMPEQTVFKNKTIGIYENAKKIVSEILCIPANEKLSKEDINYVSEMIISFYKR